MLLWLVIKMKNRLPACYLSNMSKVIVFLLIINRGLQGQLQRQCKINNKQMLNLKLIMGSRLNKSSSRMMRFTLKAISKLRRVKIRNLLLTIMNRFKTSHL